MKILFFGSSNFAVPSLRAFAERGFSIPCVVTQPDRKQGRGLHVAGTAVRNCAAELGLPVFQPQDINAPDAALRLKEYNADLFAVVAYGQILSSGVLGIPPQGALNAHASLLPKYRGAAPVSWALMNGEQQTGVTIIRLVEQMDSGPVLLRSVSAIGPDDDVCSLEEKLSLLAADLLIRAALSTQGGSVCVQPQDSTQATYAPKLKKEHGCIDWARSAEEIRNLIRGCARWPVAFTRYKGSLLKIYRARLLPPDDVRPEPGSLARVLKDIIAVGTGCGTLGIEELQLEGGRRMHASEFIAGHQVRQGDRLG